jgi:hypothetical protein
MDRKELVRSYVLNAIADDYESLEQIEKVARYFAAEEGITPPNNEELVVALKEVIAAGYAKAYLFSAPPQNLPVAVKFDIDRLQDPDPRQRLWFYVTRSGHELVVNGY